MLYSHGSLSKTRQNTTQPDCIPSPTTRNPPSSAIVSTDTQRQSKRLSAIPLPSRLIACLEETPDPVNTEEKFAALLVEPGIFFGPMESGVDIEHVH